MKTGKLSISYQISPPQDSKNDYLLVRMSFMFSSSHIRDVSNLEIAVELYLLFFSRIIVLVEYHSKNDLLAFLGMD